MCPYVCVCVFVNFSGPQSSSRWHASWQLVRLQQQLIWKPWTRYPWVWCRGLWLDPLGSGQRVISWCSRVVWSCSMGHWRRQLFPAGTVGAGAQGARAAPTRPWGPARSARQASRYSWTLHYPSLSVYTTPCISLTYLMSFYRKNKYCSCEGAWERGYNGSFRVWLAVRGSRWPLAPTFTCAWNKHWF